MAARIYKVRHGYDIVTSDNRLYRYESKPVYLGKINEKWKSSGQLLSNIPNHLKDIFFKLQNQQI